MSYTVSQLIHELEGCDPDAEVRLAHQPSWPFEYDISSVGETGNEANFLLITSDMAEEHGYDPGWVVMDDNWCLGDDPDDLIVGVCKTREEAEAELEQLGKIVYLAEGSQLGYLPGVARRAIGW